MVNKRQALDAVFSALSDSTRRAILARLMEGEARVTDLAEPFGMSLPAVSKHLRVLEQAGLLKRRIDGRVHHCRLNSEPLRSAAQWIAHYQQFWERQLDSLADYLENAQPKESMSWPSRNKAQKPRSSSSAVTKPRGRKSLKRGPTQKP